MSHSIAATAGYRLVRTGAYIGGIAVGGFVLALTIHAVLAAWTPPTQNPPGGNPTFGLHAITTNGATTSNTLTVGGMSLNGNGSEGNVSLLNQLVGNDDLFIKGNANETAAVYYGANKHEFFTGNTERLEIAGDGSVYLRNNAALRGLTAAPSNADEAASKAYVDTVVAAAGGSSGLDLVNSVHTTQDCILTGGTVFFNGSNPPFCKFSGVSMVCPTGWTQYQNWQRYSTTWGGDSCSRHISSGPSSFSNATATCKSQGSYYSTVYQESTCGQEWYWSVKGGYFVGGGWQYTLYNVNSVSCSPQANRIEIGCY